MSGTEFEGYEALVSELRATPPVAPERLRARVLALGPGAGTRMSKRRRLTFVVVPVAVVLAVGAALVHGFVSSGSHPAAKNAALRTVNSLGPLTGTTPSAAQGSAENTPVWHAPIPMAGASHGAVAAPAQRKGLKLSTFSADALNIPKNRLVHADASLQVSVKTHAALSKAT